MRVKAQSTRVASVVSEAVCVWGAWSQKGVLVWRRSHMQAGRRHGAYPLARMEGEREGGREEGKKKSKDEREWGEDESE